MIDRDGITRPDSADEHIMSASRNVKLEIDENYRYWLNSFPYRVLFFLFHTLVYFILGPYLRIKYRIRIKGRKNLKELHRQGFITIYNHVHQLDTAMLSCNVFRFRQVHYMTIKENLQFPFVRFMLRALGAFPIPEGYNNLKCFNKAIDQMLSEKQVIFIAPEGSMWHLYRELRPFKPGAFHFAARNNVPILPIAITFRNRKTLIRRKPVKRVNIEITNAIYPKAELDKKENQIEMMEYCQNLFWNKIIEAYPDIKEENEKINTDELLEIPV